MNDQERIRINDLLIKTSRDIMKRKLVKCKRCGQYDSAEFMDRHYKFGNKRTISWYEHKIGDCIKNK